MFAVLEAVAAAVSLAASAVLDAAVCTLLAAEVALFVAADALFFVRVVLPLAVARFFLAAASACRAVGVDVAAVDLFAPDLLGAVGEPRSSSCPRRRPTSTSPRLVRSVYTALA
ncbi:MAG: hypothetical protein WKF83_10335 [Nocardioidaceae bacterium]